MQELVINKDVVRGIAVPNYSNATKEQSAMVFITNRYYRIYFSIIEKAKTRTLPKNTYKGVTYTSYSEAVRITGVSRQTIKKHKGKQNDSVGRSTKRNYS